MNDSALLVFTIFNFILLFVFFYGVYTHFAKTRTHTWRGFVTLAPVSIFIAEMLMMYSREGNLFIQVGLSLLLIVTLWGTISFGYEMLVAPQLRRVTKNPRVRLVIRQAKVRQASLHWPHLPHLSSR